MTYDKLATKESINKTVAGLSSRNVEAVIVKDKAEALEKIKEFIPQGVSVMNGASKTLEQIGFVEYLKSGQHGWNNLHGAIWAEKDPAKQAALRKQSVLSDYYLGSVHALAETGEFVIASNSGSQLPHIVFTSSNLIFVVSAKKIVPTLMEAIQRVREYVLPLEDERALQAYGMHTSLNKMLIFENENPMMARKVRMIIINEDLGF